jgi:hypothetical protein
MERREGHETTTIYVRLIDEPVPAWRPVKAEHIAGNVYLIVAQPYNQDMEAWEYQPGERVVCQTLLLSDGPTLAAVRGSERSIPADAE